ncbi:hypothetical protein [Nostoc sp.]
MSINFGFWILDFGFWIGTSATLGDAARTLSADPDHKGMGQAEFYLN